MNWHPQVVEISIACFVFSVLSDGLNLIAKKMFYCQAAAGCWFLGFSGMTLALLLRGVSGDWTPWTSLYGSYLLLSWLILVTCWAAARRIKSVFPRMTAALAVSFLLAYSQWLEDDGILRVPQLRSFWFHFHETSKILSHAMLVVSLIIGVCAVLKHRRRVNTDQWMLTAHKVMAVGFVLLTLSLAGGVVWSYETTGSYWTQEWKTAWILVSWFVYAGYFHLAVRKKCGLKHAVWPAIAGFCWLMVS